MPRRKASLFAAFALAAFLAAAPADARRTVIDIGEFIDPGTLEAACVIGGAACTSVTMPFSFDFGNGLTDQAFIYDRGIVSFGEPIPSGVDPTGSFADFGVPVIAPLYAPGPTGVAGPYQASAGTMQPGFGFTPGFTPFNPDLFVVTFLEPSTFDPNTTMGGYVWLILDASSDELRFEFVHGQSNTQPDEPTILASPNTAGTSLGYSLLGQDLVDTTPDIEGPNVFSVVRAGVVPEPGTWAMVLLGFGAIGFAMRRGRNAGPRAIAA